jgi:hypothetical protein
MKTVSYLSEKEIDLFDIISKKYLAKAQSGKIALKIPAGEACVLVELPSGTKLTKEANKLKANGTIISFR